MQELNAARKHPTNPSHREKVAFTFLLALLFLAPWDYGSNRPLSSSLLALASAVLILGYVSSGAINSTSREALRPDLKLPFFLFAIVTSWITFQALVPLPRSWGDPIWAIAAEHLGVPRVPSHISIAPAATMSALMRLLTYFSVFWLSFRLSENAVLARRSVTAILLLGAVYSIIGLIIHFCAGREILSFQVPLDGGALKSTFANRNHFATFVGLCLLCGTAQMLHKLQPLVEQRRTRSQTFAVLIEHVFVARRWETGAILLMLLALFLTMSRGGVLASLFALFALIFLLSRNKTQKQNSLSVWPPLLGILFAVLISAGGPFLGRLGQAGEGESATLRTSIYQSAVNGILSAPWQGVGFGSFEDAYPAYKQDDVSPMTRVGYAHNTYLESTFELGVPVAFLLHLSLAALLFVCWRGTFRRRRMKYVPAIGVAATLLVAVHSLVDFSLEIPAVSVLYAFMMGFAAAQSRSPDGPRT